MSDKKEISAIDAIYKILADMNELKTTISLMDQNIKLLNNKIYKLESSIVKNKIHGSRDHVKNVSEKNVKNDFSAQPSVPDDKKQSSGLILGKVKVYGYIVNATRIPISGVQVVVTKMDKKIRDLKSNKEGYWEARLPSGNYKISYIHNDFKTISRDVSIPNNVNIYEVR